MPPSDPMPSSDSDSDSPMAAGLAAPSLPWRFGSATIMAATGLLCRGFLRGLSNLEVRGQDRFLELLDQRRDVGGRERGLITVANHVSVLDDPLIWGSLPLRYMFTPDNLRWSLASHDLAFTNKVLSTFFNFGQTLPTHRLAHSPYGGLFQPTITQAIRLLSRGPFTSPSATPPTVHPADIPDPFTSATLTYTTNGHDTFPAPCAYASRRHAWIHIFPEGKVHQKEDHTMRYFKWGVARLILESDPCPDIVPMWVQGPQYVMHESREFPRFLPRPGKTVSVTFGERVGEDVFGDLRARWRELRERDEAARRQEGGAEAGELALGVLSEGLKYGKEAVELRMECTMRVREQVLMVRRSTGLPDEDPKAGLVETYAIEGGKRQEGKMEDDSWVKDT